VTITVQHESAATALAPLTASNPPRPLTSVGDPNRPSYLQMVRRSASGARNVGVPAAFIPN
jgi:hypothetical protein